MTDFFYLIPIALALGATGLAVFLWTLRNGQYDDLDGAAERILFDDDFPLKTRQSELGDASSPAPPSELPLTMTGWPQKPAKPTADDKIA